MALYENIFKRMRNLGAVILRDGQLLDKNDNVIPTGGGEGGGGGGGDPQPADVAGSIAAADSKTTPADNDELAIVDSAADNILKSVTFSDLKAAIQAYLLGLDFVRVNATKDLVNGTNQVVTQAAIGIRQNFLVDTSISDLSSSGLFKFNTATLTVDATVTLMMDYLDRNGTDMSDYIATWQAAGTIYIRSASVTDTSYAVLAINSVADQDPATYLQISCKVMAANAFVGGEPCVINYAPPTNVASAISNASTKATPVDADKLAISDSAASGSLKSLSWLNIKTGITAYLLSLGFTRVDANGNMLDGSNNIIDGVNPVYALASAPVSGITTLPAANIVTDGNVIALHKDCLVGAGRNPAGLLLKADFANNLWRPANDRILLFSKRFGTYASPALTMTSASQASSSKFNVGVDPVIPANLIYAGCTLIIEMNFRRNVSLVGLGNVQVLCYMGTDAATQTNNSAVWEMNMTDADDRDVFPAPEIVFNTLTSVSTTRNISKGEGGIASAGIDRSTLINAAANMTITWRVQTTLDANNSVDFLGYKIWLVGA